MKDKKLFDKYSDDELAESFVFRTKLSEKQKSEASKALKEAREKIKRAAPPEQEKLFNLLQLKFQIEDYLDKSDYKKDHSFGNFLRQYIRILEKKNREFANDIGVEETELSQLINKHRPPTEKVLVRLEIHSNKIFPAVIWYRLLEKEKEFEITRNLAMRKVERKNVKNALTFHLGH